MVIDTDHQLISLLRPETQLLTLINCLDSAGLSNLFFKVMILVFTKVQKCILEQRLMFRNDFWRNIHEI